MAQAQCLTTFVARAADEAVQKLVKETGEPKRLAALAVDVSDPKSIDAAAQTLEREYAGKLGGLINNAGVRATSTVPVTAAHHVPSAYCWLACMTAI